MSVSNPSTPDHCESPDTWSHSRSRWHNSRTTRTKAPRSRTASSGSESRPHSCRAEVAERLLGKRERSIWDGECLIGIPVGGMDTALTGHSFCLRVIHHTAAPTSRAGGHSTAGDSFMYRRLSSIGIALTSIALVACSDSISANANTHVSVQDQCDPTSFNAALGAGTCSKQGNMTFAQFNSELSATHQVAAWRFVPQNLTV